MIGLPETLDGFKSLSNQQNTNQHRHLSQTELMEQARTGWMRPYISPGVRRSRTLSVLSEVTRCALKMKEPLVTNGNLLPRLSAGLRKKRPARRIIQPFARSDRNTRPC